MTVATTTLKARERRTFASAARRRQTPIDKGARTSPFIGTVDVPRRTRRGTKALSSRVPVVADAEEFVHDVVAMLLREEPTCFFFEWIVGSQQVAAVGHQHASRLVVLLAGSRGRYVAPQGNEPQRFRILDAHVPKPSQGGR